MNYKQLCALVTHAYFYLIREREFALRGEDVYKLGITKQVMGLKIPRFYGYKKGSELIMITECPMALLESIETALKKLFCETFTRHSDGREHFIGDRRHMSDLIYKACSDAWTSEQKQLRASTLRSVLELQEATNTSGSVTHTGTKQTRKAVEDASPDLAPAEADKASETAEAARNATELAADNARRLNQDNLSFTKWFDERVDKKVDAYVKQAVWYTDYRRWASRADIVPVAESTAVATFKRLYSATGISVGNKTYGIQLKVDPSTVVGHTQTPPSHSLPETDILSAEIASADDTVDDNVFPFRRLTESQIKKYVNGMSANNDGDFYCPRCWIFKSSLKTNTIRHLRKRKVCKPASSAVRR